MLSSQQDASVADVDSDGTVADTDAACPAADGNNDTILPKPTAVEVHACQFSSWYYTFRNMDTAFSSTSILDDTTTNNIKNKKRNKLRKNITIESIIIRPLPSDFIQYLLSDGVRLPDCATKVSSCMNADQSNDRDGNSSCGSSDDENDDDDDDYDDDDEPEIKYSFPTLTQQLQSSINQLGNICMPKMNWSSPKDATWINCGTLKCSTPGDVYLLLKSSDFIVFDLEKAWVDLHDESCESGEVTKEENCDKLEHLKIDESSDESSKLFRQDKFEHELILRKWCNLHPSMEFRCFVYENELGE